jgi:hypothetical protein
MLMAIGANGMAELVGEALAVGVEEETTFTAKGFGSQELELGAWAVTPPSSSSTAPTPSVCPPPTAPTLPVTARRC